MITISGKMLPLVLALLTLSSISGGGKSVQTEGGGAPKVSIVTPANNIIRYNLGLTFIAGTFEGTDVREVGVSIRRVGTNEEWSATKKKGRFVAGPTGKWLKASIDGNNWYVPVSSYRLPTFADLLPEDKDEMRYIIYVYAKDSAGRSSEEGEGTMIIVRR